MNDSVHIPTKTVFLPSTYARFQVEKLSEAEIDEMLANGYFRNDLIVYTTVARFVESDWRPCLMLRIPLTEFVWKKRLRKLLRRNGKELEVVIQPFQPRPKMEQLWQDFKSTVHGWEYVPNLQQHLFRGRPVANFHSWEVCVYDGQRLVAFSVFDKGLRSLASLEAAYHPDYQKFSLGLYTMLLEMEWAIQQGVEWYYPGFYPKGIPMFDYKLRPGGVEFFKLRQKKWMPWEQIEPADWVYLEIIEKLKKVEGLLNARGVWVALHRSRHSNLASETPTVTDHYIYLETSLKNVGKEVERSRVVWNIFNQQYEVFSWEMPTQSKSDNQAQAVVFPFDAYKLKGRTANSFEAAHLVSS